MPRTSTDRRQDKELRRLKRVTDFLKAVAIILGLVWGFAMGNALISKIQIDVHVHTTGAPT